MRSSFVAVPDINQRGGREDSSITFFLPYRSRRGKEERGGKAQARILFVVWPRVGGKKRGGKRGPSVVPAEASIFNKRKGIAARIFIEWRGGREEKSHPTILLFPRGKKEGKRKKECVDAASP